MESFDAFAHAFSVMGLVECIMECVESMERQNTINPKVYGWAMRLYTKAREWTAVQATYEQGSYKKKM